MSSNKGRRGGPNLPAWALNVNGNAYSNHSSNASIEIDDGSGDDPLDYHKMMMQALLMQSNELTTANTSDNDNMDGALPPTQEELESMSAFLKTVESNPEAAAALLQSLSDKDDSSRSKQSITANMIEIQPIPGFVLKTRLAAAHEDWPAQLKVLINICFSAEIPAPPTSDYEEAARAVREGDNTTFKVPLSLSGPRPDKDKEGKVCLVFEACVNTVPFEMAQKDVDFKFFLIQLCFEWLEEKHKLQLERDYTLPKLKAKGPLSKHYIRKTAKSLVTEMSKTVLSETVSAANSQSAQPIGNKGVKPAFEMIMEPFDAKVPEFIVVNVQLPRLASTKPHLVLDLTPYKLFLSPSPSTTNTSPYAPLEIPLPFPIDVEQTGAQFDRSRRVLCVTMFVDES